jgi:hypothetical protein
MIVTPEDSRYVPLTQQPFCCVPTCIQIVMHKNGIPLLPAEEIGYHLGLVVGPADAHLFYKVRVSDTPPPAGYGTRIYDPQFEPNKAFEKLKIKLSFSIKPISEISSSDDLLNMLQEVEAQNGDALLCFNHGALVDDPSRNWGHVCVFDRVEDGKIRIIDPSPNHPKWRTVEAAKMLEAMQKHGVQRSAGIWRINKKSES